MNRHEGRGKTVISTKEAVSLLYPIAAFFTNGGLNKAQSLAALASAIDEVCKSAGKRELEHIGAPTSYSDVIATWSRERKFLDSRGRPRPLALSGANGFRALVRSAGAPHDPKEMLNVLLRYKNVRRLPDGRIRLVSPLFRASAGSRMAFEPIACFLHDASSTLTSTLKRAGSPSDPDLFWRLVESVRVSKSDATKFMEFAKDRSLLFLEELYDWLEAHERPTNCSNAQRLRVGLGLFSIYSRKKISRR